MQSERRSLNRQTSKGGSTHAGNEFNYGPWHVEYLLNDGGRLSRLAYRDYDLLTTVPLRFRPPAGTHGHFEDRPVYGYDDCFPSVVACYYPGSHMSIPDHGELCWLPWELSEEPDALTFLVRSKLLPVVFRRKMIFTDTNIVWQFEVQNDGEVVLPFQHSMHPLLSVNELKRVELPGFESVLDWNKNRMRDPVSPEKLAGYLLGLPEGSVEMLFLRNVRTGELSWTYFNGLSVKMKYPAEHFPTVGVWWDNSGYPEEDDIRRNECAFEPTPGPSSLLTEAYADGNCLFVGPHGRFAWQVTWDIEVHGSPNGFGK